MRRTALVSLSLLAVTLSAPSVHATRRYQQLVRLTEYDDTGYTYSGLYTAHGIAGCSPDIPLFSTIVLPGGQTALCADRGVDDGVERVDLWNGDGGWGCIPCVYGDWVVVEVQ